MPKHIARHNTLEQRNKEKRKSEREAHASMLSVLTPTPELREFASGVVSTKSPRYGLIWPSALKALARRMERGERTKKDKACNALNTKNRLAPEDAQFVIDRLEHGIEHCYKAIARISGNLPELDEQDTYDGGDAGAILFCGALLAEYKARGK